MNTKPFISISNPCHEDWNKMSPNEQGRHCSVCCKTVVDFTKMSDDEIKQYFLKYKEQKTCGTFHSSQVTQNQTSIQKTFLKWHQIAYQQLNNPIPRMFVLFFISSLLTMTGCTYRTTGEPSNIEPDTTTIKSKNSKTSSPDTSDAKKQN